MEPKSSFRGKPYNLFGDYLLEKYGARVFKIPLNSDFSCPNRDGSVGRDGCIFCSDDGSASPGIKGLTIKEQCESAIKNFSRSDEDTRYISYFQAYTNTYADNSFLKEKYSEAVNFSDKIIGLMIGTRPDCLPDSTVDMISGFKKDNFELWIEIGMQSMHEGSLRFLKRGHTHEDTRNAVKRAAARNIPVCVHVITGIPGENWRDIMQTAREISSLPVSGVKLHQLHVIKGTLLEKLYRMNSLKLPDMSEYASITVDILERLRPDILIHRLSADREENTLIAPLWGNHKGSVIKEIDRQFRERATWQGFLHDDSSPGIA